MKNILIRSLSGAVYVAIIVVLVLWGGQIGFPLLCCAFTILGMTEFLQITTGGMSKNPAASALDLFLGLCIPVMVFYSLYLPVTYSHSFFIVMLGVFIMLAIIRLVMQLYSTSPRSLERMAYTIMSMVYVALPLSAAVAVYNLAGPELTLFVFVLIWLNATGAFLVGSAIGSHRLFARLSPKKSWEGFFGGLGFCIVAAYVAYMAVPGFGLMPRWQLVVLAVVVSVLSTWGDLFESMLKRNVGVKDSGNLMPGHGGVLDRIDSMLFVMPATLVLIIFSNIFCN